MTPTVRSLNSQRPSSADVLDVLRVGFTPVKGMRHLCQPHAEFDEHGPVGDRRFCLIDTEQRRVLKTVQNPMLVAVTARMSGDELEMTLPDGSSARSVPDPSGEVLTCEYWGRPLEMSLLNGPHSELMSSWLGKRVGLAEAPRGGVVFGGSISLVATASIRDLGDRMGHPVLLTEATRFRATLLVDTTVPYIEETWSGREMAFGETRFRIGGPIPRCAVMDLDPSTGERNQRVMKSLAAYRPRNESGEPYFGVYAQVVNRTAP